MKSVSAALIVRNEEHHIGACLQSIAGLVDEVVVVDTGSYDRSREIAADHGARIFDYEWHDDFAAARNYAIDRATGGWILYIDADERTRAYDRRILEGELGDPSLCACTVRFYRAPGPRLTRSIACSGATRKSVSGVRFTRQSYRT